MRTLRVLIGCECSGVIRRAFRALGHDAMSCDLKPADDGLRAHHYQCDVFDAIEDGPWDLGIFHPVCKRLANSGVLRLYVGGKKINGIDPVQWKAMEDGAAFFLKLWNCKIKRVCVENPVQHCHAKKIIGCRQSQTVQPYEFGDPESKRTALWLRELPLLVPTNILPLPECGHWENQTPSGQNKLGPSDDRAAIRAETYPGIAKAMADQWSRYILSP